MGNYILLKLLHLWKLHPPPLYSLLNYVQCNHFENLKKNFSFDIKTFSSESNGIYHLRSYDSLLTVLHQSVWGLKSYDVDTTPQNCDC